MRSIGDQTLPFEYEEEKRKESPPLPLSLSPQRRGGGEGEKILITRAREQSGDFATRLKKLGAEVIEFPAIEIVPPLRWKELDQAIDQLKSYDWILFTSANGVKFFWQRLREKGRRYRLPSSLKVCAIGPATANQLKERDFPSTISQKSLSLNPSLKGLKKSLSMGNGSFWLG